MSETPTGTDRVELTEDERAQLRSHGQKWAEDAQLGDLFFEPVESIVAARVQAKDQRIAELETALAICRS